MKLATYQDGSRDGQLVVVSRDLASAHYASGIATRLQAVLDDWNFLSPQLQDLFDDLNAGRARHAFAFDPAHCMAPLPRVFGYAEGGAYLHHRALIAEASGGATPKALQMLRLAGSELLGPQDPVVLPPWLPGVPEPDFEAGIAVVTGDIPMGCTPDRALEGVRLVMLANGIALRGLGADDIAFHSRPATAFSPVAVTPDELGASWSGGRLAGTLQTVWNGRKVGLCDAGPDMDFSFSQLVAAAARYGRLRAGTIVGSGPVSNPGTQKDAGKDGKRVRKTEARIEASARFDWPRGYGSIAEKRAMETLQDGAAKTGFLQPHDTLRVEMKGRDGQSMFGAIAHELMTSAG
jgi:fumarylacetoacetate (FAA) hydrolase